MNFKDLLAAALVLVVSFALRYLLGLLNIQLDEELFNTIVASIVAYLLALFGVEAARARGVRGILK